MEVMYKKLYDKYNELKAMRFSELDVANEDLQSKFQNFLNASDTYVNHLMSENEQLRNEVVLLSSTKDQQYEDIKKLLSEERQKSEDIKKLLFEERQKNKELTKEIENLLKLQQESTNLRQEANTPHDTLARKRRRLSGNASDPLSAELVHSDLNHLKESEPAPSLSQENNDHVDHQQPQCCRSPNDSGPCNCLFQDLIECLTSMNVSVVRQSDSAVISVLHQSSGYSFELTCLKNPGNAEAEFLYKVSSLGTFERVAPQWMRETIIFSFRMCPIFFERVSHFIKLS